MSEQPFQSELLVEITTEQQEILSAGQCPSRVFLNARCGYYTPENPFGGFGTFAAPAPLGRTRGRR